MVKQLQYRRLLMLVLLLAAAFVGLGYRLVDLQVLRHPQLVEEARNKTRHTYPLEPRRGDILDAKGNLLATSVFVKTVCADPSLIGNHQAEVAHAIAPILKLNEHELAQRLTEHPRINKQGEVTTNHYVRLKQKVSTEDWERVRTAMSNLTFGIDEKRLPKKDRDFCRILREKAISTDPVDDQLRTYPNQRLASHVLGYVGTIEHTNADSHWEEAGGVDGIERYFNTQLSGIRGRRVSERDRQNREMVALRVEDIEAQDGLNVVLTVDSVIQHIVETELAEVMKRESPISASGIVIRPKTGEILAMAVLPDYDPNNPGAEPEASRHDRIISYIAEPGSTFKIVVVSGALNDQIVRLTDEFDCEHGRFAFAGRVLHDHAPYGTLSVEDIIAHSSNIGAGKIGIKMGEHRLYDYVKDFGFGDATGIPLPGEVRGLVYPVKKWSKVSIAQIPMGQGVAVTSLQMAMAMCAIANGGVLMRPMLVNRLQDQDGNVAIKYSPQEVRRVLSDQADKEIIEALKKVVSDQGTAPKAKLDNYTVAGKTGTAQKPPYDLNKFYASFIGFFPADDPEICIYVSLDEPKGALHQGGQVAAPTFKDIAEKVANYLNIHPDRQLEQAALDTSAAGADKLAKAGSLRLQ
jgi:cell division protein FtsI/penicillin-binding protein 2